MSLSSSVRRIDGRMMPRTDAVATMANKRSERESRVDITSRSLTLKLDELTTTDLNQSSNSRKYAR